MTAFEIDTEASVSASRTWIAWGDQLQGSQLELGDGAIHLELAVEAASACWSLASAAGELWSAGTTLRLVVDRAEAVDAVHASGFGDGTVAALERAAGWSLPVGVSACPIDASFSPLAGDLGSTYVGELRSPYVIEAEDESEAGRQLVLRALADTGSNAQVRADEFEIVQLGDGRTLVVLPGVQDLSRPSLGLSPVHRSVRDLDEFAYRSSRSSSVSDDAYARMVWEGLVRHGVAAGSDLVLIGHSFGADAALDLAAEPAFNGPGGYRVTHVVAAGYRSQPQLANVPADTEVLVLQNRRDAAVIAEAVGDAHVADLIESEGAAIDSVLRLDLPGATSGVARAGYHGVAAASTMVAHVFGRADDVAELAEGIAALDPGRALAGVSDLLTLEPGTSRPRPSQVVAVFDGGVVGAGHHQRNYVEFLAATSDAAVVSFLASLAGGAAVAIGSAHAIDVSVPDDAEKT